MMNLSANDPAAPIGRVQAIAFGQEMLQRPPLRGKNLTSRTIPALQRSGRCSAMRPLALVMNPTIPLCAAHSCSKIRQVKPRPRDGDSQRVTRVQAEKPHARLSTASHIGSDVQFGKCGEPWHRRRRAQPHAGHAKRNYREPGAPFKGVDLQLGRKKRAQYCGVDRPVRKEQVVPALRHHPRPTGQRPGPERDFLQDCAHPGRQTLLDKVIFRIYPSNKLRNQIL